jgi:hypothetical protein
VGIRQQISPGQADQLSTGDDPEGQQQKLKAAEYQPAGSRDHLAGGELDSRRGDRSTRQERHQRRDQDFSKSDAGAVTTVSVSAYREAMAEFAGMGVLEMWYSRMSEEDFVALGRAATTGSKQQKSILESPEGAGEGTYPRQPARPVQADRGDRRPVPHHHQRAADRHPRA